MDATASRPPDLRYSKLHFILESALEYKSVRLKNEYTHDVQTNAYRILGTDFPFELEQLMKFFSILDYDVTNKTTSPLGIEVSW